jgi:hypothetical protein
MMPEEFNALVDEIMSQGYDEATASRYAALIGDLPVTDDTDGKLLVMNNGQVIARLKPLKFFDAT